MNNRTGSILAIIGGALMAGGSFLPWLSARSGFGTLDITGIEGDGIISLIAGVLVAIIALDRFDRPMSRSARAVVILASIGAAAVVLVNFQEAQRRISNVNVDTDAIVASVGLGLWVVGLGVALALVASFRAFTERG